MEYDDRNSPRISTPTPPYPLPPRNGRAAARYWENMPDDNYTSPNYHKRFDWLCFGRILLAIVLALAGAYILYLAYYFGMLMLFRGRSFQKIYSSDTPEVNVNAIEDYRTLMEEYTFMKNQYDDLKKAEEQLIGFIDELDKAMRKQFEEKFAEIKVEFDKVFKELFGGGKGTIELMEDEDVLEAGIRIIAQPPGKKLQNMMQLSGGEKALTAIALLFAIQNLKPSPFCLLDEIEAALDESNVGRFAGYLHKLTKHTQFIVITHRRGTMEQADRLYGITMQEKGVSTLVSVDLIDKDLK